MAVPQCGSLTVGASVGKEFQDSLTKDNITSIGIENGSNLYGRDVITQGIHSLCAYLHC